MSYVKRAITNGRRPKHDEAAEKALSTAVALAGGGVPGGATYATNPNPSSPFTQTGGMYGDANPLPRPYATFQSGFGPAFPFTPDAIDPLRPDGRADFRRDQYRVAYNLSFDDRDVPWILLRQIATQVDVVNRCIELVQDAAIGMRWSFSYSPQIIDQIKYETGETNNGKAVQFAREKYGDSLTRVRKFFETPDQQDGYTFSAWLTEMIWCVLVYDGVAIAPFYTRKGDLHSLSQIDPSTIKLLRDARGFRPQPPAPAYQQWLYGFPRSEAQAWANPNEKPPKEFTQDQMRYYVRRPRPHTLYGYSTVEETINIATLYQQRQEWMHAEWSMGSTPKGVIKTTGTEGWTPEQFQYFSSAINDELSGQTRRRQQVLVLRPGMEWEQLKDFAELYTTDFDEWCVMQIGSKFGVPQSQLGIPMKSMRSMSGTQNQTSMDLTDKFALDSLVNHLVDIVNDLAQRFLGIGSEITMTVTSGNGDESDLQRAQADASDVNSGIRTRNEVRQERGDPLVTTAEADELGVTTATGVTFITGGLAAQEAQQAQLESGVALTNPRQRSSHLDERADPDIKPTGVKPKPKSAGDSRQPDATQTGAATGGYSSKELNDSHTRTEGNADIGDGSGTSRLGKDQVGGNGSGGSGYAGGPSNRTNSATREQERELAAFSKFAKTRIETGKGWRGFSFEHVDVVLADSLNAAGASGDYELVKTILEKRQDYPAGGETSSPVASGIAVRAKDSGRVLLLQRALDPTDQAQGTFEWPGGCIESGETPAEAAVREWQEETGIPLPDGEMITDWICPVGTYQTFLWEIPSESDIPINTDNKQILNPDDPDQDHIETLAWFDVADLPGASFLRDEMQMNPWHTITTKPILTSPQSQSKTIKALETIAQESSDFLQYASGRVRAGRGWRDFEFNTIVSETAKELNDLGREGDMVTLKAIVGDLQKHSLGKAEASRKAGRIDRVALYEELHERITQHYAPKIAHAMRNISGLHEAVEQARSVWPQYTKAAGDDENPTPDITPIATEGFSESPQLGPIGSDIALSAIESNITFDKEGIKNTLQDIYQDAAAAGIGVGNLQLSAIASWKPGNPSAADLVANGALREILTSLKITLKGLTDSAIDRMGSILAEGLNQGLPPLQIAKNMSEIIADPKRALVIARSETARAMGLSTLIALKHAGTAQWMWHDNAGACAICVNNADNSPYPIDEGPAFPAHPNCRCQPLPYVDLS